MRPGIRRTIHPRTSARMAKLAAPQATIHIEPSVGTRAMVFRQSLLKNTPPQRSGEIPAQATYYSSVHKRKVRCGYSGNGRTAAGRNQTTTYKTASMPRHHG